MPSASAPSRRAWLRTAFLQAAILLAQVAFAQSEAAKHQRQDGRLKILDQSTYKPWLEEDVAWIITAEERTVFKQLHNDQERDLFIAAFWSRRDPTPDTFENEVEEEHYRRIIYANEHFGKLIPGWKSDCGCIYILYGRPDEIETYPHGETEPPAPEGEVPFVRTPNPVEVWRYRYLEGVGQDVTIRFVDVCKCGNFEMTMSNDLKDALVYVPSTMARRNRKVIDPQPFLLVTNPPQPRFKNLESLLNSEQRSSLLPLKFVASSTKATDVTSLVSLTVSVLKSDLAQPEGQESTNCSAHIFGRVLSLTGQIVNTFEGSAVSDSSVDPAQESHSADIQYSVVLPIRVGRYRVDIAAQDVNSGRTGTRSRGLVVQ
jgi:GWxTD domain-containing protein